MALWHYPVVLMAAFLMLGLWKLKSESGPMVMIIIIVLSGLLAALFAPLFP